MSIRSVPIILISLAIPVLLAGCNENKETQKWITTTAHNLEAVRVQSGNLPYRSEQQTAFKVYFSGLAEAVYKLKQDPKHAQAFNSAVAKLDLNEVCNRALQPKTEWSTLANNCMRNRFFICAEEVRAYPEIINALFEHLTPGNRESFEKAPACRRVTHEE